MSSNNSGYSLRQRLGWQLLLAIGLALGGLFILLDVWVDRAIYTQFDQFLAARAQALAQTIDRIPADNNHPGYELAGHAEFHARFDAAGQLLHASGNSGQQPLQLPPTRQAHTAVFSNLPLPDGHRGRAIVLPLADGGWLMLAAERESWDATEWHVHLTLLAGAIIAIALPLALAFWLLQRAFAPIQHAGEQLRQLPPDALPASMPSPLPTELQPYVPATQGALEQLAEAVERERRLSRNIAHELRTPLAEIRLSAENALHSNNTRHWHDSLEAILDINGHMERSVHALLALARHESGQMAPALDPLDLSALIRHQCGHLPLACQPRLQLLLPDELWIHSDPDMLERILSNLLHNACQYAPGSTPIRLDTAWQQGQLWLQLHNAAPDLVAEDLRHFGEHYWRKPETADAAAGTHAGLGLALARAISKVLGQQLHFQLANSTLTVRLGPLPLL